MDVRSNVLFSMLYAKLEEIIFASYFKRKVLKVYLGLV